MTAQPDTTHRGHRIDAINAGPRGWVAYVDMHEVGVGVNQQDAHDFARRWIDDAIWKQFMRRDRTAELIAATRPLPQREFRGLRLVHDADRDERVERGIGRPADELGSW